VLAIALGVALRFESLGAREMSPDEGASWGAASAPTVSAVVARQAILNPGKLPIHDLMLHAWIAVFGQSLTAIRAMSASIDSISILLVFFVAWQMFADAGALDPPTDAPDVLLVGSVSALLFAVNLVAIKYAREARMYPVMLAAIIAQVGFFLRVLQRGGMGNLVALATLTAIGVGANFSAMLVPLTEGLWLLSILVSERFSFFMVRAQRAWAAAVALAIGGAILLPQLVSSFGKTAAHTSGGIIHWIKPPAIYEPLALFNKATGSFAFPVLAALAIWGVYRGWRGAARRPVKFALLWMWGPPLILMIASYALTPIFVERYALSCFVPFFILAALGIVEMPRESVRIAALALAVAMSLGHIWSYDRKPHDTQYAEAIEAARASLKPGELMTIVPGYAIEVAHYYLPDDAARTVRYEQNSSPAEVMIMGDQNLSPQLVAAIRHDYPNKVASFRGVVVLRK
jgi:mannosyltransferase